MSKIRLTDGRLLYGYIIHASDSTITVVKKSDWKKQWYERTEVIPAERISGVTKNFKKLTVGEGALAGGLAGLLLGISFMLFTHCEDSDGDGNCDFSDRVFSDKSLKAYFILTGGLGLVGMFIGLFSRKKEKMYYDIGGKRDNIKYNKIGLTF